MDSSLPLNTASQHDQFRPRHAANHVTSEVAVQGEAQNSRPQSQARYDDSQRLAACIAACATCERVAQEFADASDRATQLVRLARDCAELCGATARLLPDLLGREFTLMSWRLNACSRVCAEYRAALETSQKPETSREVAALQTSEATNEDPELGDIRQTCVEACHDCETACRALLDSLNPARHPLLSANSEWVLDAADSAA
jgi:hypothetical protein